MVKKNLTCNTKKLVLSSFPTKSKCKFNSLGGCLMFGIGIPELLVLLLIALVIFGANKLPEIGAGLVRP